MRFWKKFLHLVGLTDFLIRRDGNEAIATIAEDLAVVRSLKDDCNLRVVEIRARLWARNGSPELSAAIHDLDEAATEGETVGDIDSAFYLSYVEERLTQASFSIFQFAVA